MIPLELAKTLGGSSSGDWINIPGPNHSSGDRSLGFRFDPSAADGIRVNSFADDDPSACRKHVINKLGALGHPTLSMGLDVDPLDENQLKRAKALLLWEYAVDPCETLAQKYLESRGCYPGHEPSVANALRFHPRCTMGQIATPAMVALMRDAVTGRAAGVHRTALADDGSSKRTMPEGAPARMMLGRAKRAVVMISSKAPAMGIAEGIETALSAQKIFGVPVWACLSAQGIADFPSLDGLMHLTIFADHDKTEITAAEKCAARLHRRGMVGKIAYPPTPGDDWNSYLQHGGADVG